MGNTPAKIGVQVDGSTAEAGACLKGKVYLSIQKQGQLGRGVCLKLEGQERSEIVRDHDSNDRRSRHVDRSSSTLVCMNVPLATFDSGVVPQGQHEFPFEWPLPDNLPSSTICNDGESSCRIEYKLTAYLDGSAQFLQDYTSSVSVTILGTSHSQHSGPIQMDLEEFPIRACCDNKGTMMMGWDADTTIAAPRHTMTVGIFGKNDSVTRVEYLSAKIVETISWNANGHSRRKTRTLCAAKLYTDMNDMWRPLAKKPRRRHYRYNEVETDSHVLENRIAVPLQLPTDSRDTYTGHVMNVSHSLVVTAVTPGACCITSPQSSISVQIQRKMPSESAYVAAAATAPPAELDMSDFVTAPSLTPPPMAVAQVLPDNWTPKQHDIVVIPASCVASDSSALPIAAATVVPTAPMETETIPVDLFEGGKQTMRHNITTLVELQTRIATSNDPAATLQNLLVSQPHVGALLSSLSPHEFVQMTSTCGTNIAPVLAQAMGANLQCRHVLACLWALPQNGNRLAVVQAIAPLASDFHVQREMIERELSPVELRNFRSAVA